MHGCYLLDCAVNRVSTGRHVIACKALHATDRRTMSAELDLPVTTGCGFAHQNHNVGMLRLGEAEPVHFTKSDRSEHLRMMQERSDRRSTTIRYVHSCSAKKGMKTLQTVPDTAQQSANSKQRHHDHLLGFESSCSEGLVFSCKSPLAASYVPLNRRVLTRNCLLAHYIMHQCNGVQMTLGNLCCQFLAIGVLKSAVLVVVPSQNLPSVLARLASTSRSALQNNHLSPCRGRTMLRCKGWWQDTFCAVHICSNCLAGSLWRWLSDATLAGMLACRHAVAMAEQFDFCEVRLSTSMREPAAANRYAVVKPAIPAPTTQTSV